MTTLERTPPAPPERAARDERLDTRWLLDEAVAGQSRGGDLRHAAWYAVGLGVTVLLLELAFGLAVHAGMPRGDASLAGEVTIGIATYLCCRPLLRAAGDRWRGFGVAAPRWRDVALAARWFFAQMVVRCGVVIVAVAAIPALRHGQRVSNLNGLHNLSTAQVVLVAIGAVVVAPVVEEIAFRGLWLRALMPRMGFWPAALLSSLVFGLLHAHEGASVAVAVVLVAATGAFGVLQSMLVRRSGRLAPAMFVHAAVNALALAVTIAAAR